MKYLTSHLEVKNIENNGVISGYASVFNVTDSYGDVVVPGAFKTSVTNFNDQQKPKLLWQHNTSCPIGVIENIYEDKHGLFVRCRLLLDLAQAREAYSLLINKAIDGFSIGYKLRDSYFDRGHQYLTDIDLQEISIVTFPACESAKVSDVKAQDDTTHNITQLTNIIRNYLQHEQRYTTRY